MNLFSRREAIGLLSALGGARLRAAASAWSAPAEVHHDDRVCMSYRARVDGPYLVIQVKLEPGWHTFAIDNKARVDEKLAGRKALTNDKPTSITLAGGLKAEGPWLQSPPKDFSKPELRLFAYGFENEATFAVKVSGKAPARIAIQGQACTDTVCKNIDLDLPLAAGQPSTTAQEFDPAKLVRARVTT